jgi:hypothetical protein
MCEVYLEAFFFFTGLREDGAVFFFELPFVDRVAAKATDLSAFSAILFNQASISVFSSEVTTETLGAFAFLLNLIFGNPLACNFVTSFFVAGVTFVRIGFALRQSFKRNCWVKKT